MNTFVNSDETVSISADSILEHTPKNTPLRNAFKTLLEYALERCKDNEFWLQEGNIIAQELLPFWKFLQQRAPEQIVIKAFNPTIEDQGFESDYTYIYISHNDAPYIVDSVQLALHHLNLETHCLLSIGAVSMIRDATGTLKDVSLEAQDNPNCISEDPIFIQINKQLDQSQLTHIENYLNSVLKEVHLVYRDSPLMREKCLSIIEECENFKRLKPSENARETITFLKWLLDDHFTFFGYREYRAVDKDNDPALELINNSGLGLLRDESRAIKTRKLSSMPQEAQRIASSDEMLAITKTNTKSRIHCAYYTDYIGVKVFDSKGEVVGEHRFIGLFSHSAYNDNIKNVPHLRQKVNNLMTMMKISPQSHLGKKVMNILENFPRDELFQITTQELFQIVNAILKVRGRPALRLLARKDPYNRFYSCFVYIPKEKINASLYQKFSDLLLEAFSGNEISMRVSLTDAILGRIHYVIRLPEEARNQATPDIIELEQKLIAASKTWQEKLRDELDKYYDRIHAAKLYKAYEHGFGVAYQEDFDFSEVLDDIQSIEKISDEQPYTTRLFYHPQDPSDWLSFKFYQLNQPTTLSEIIPTFENMGLEVIEENPYECNLADKIIWISHYRIKIREMENPDLATIKPLFDSLFNALYEKKVENDQLNALVLKCQLPCHLIAALRAYCCYYKQVGIYSQAYLEKALLSQYQITKKLVQLFALRFDPAGDHDSEVIELKADIKKSLAKVSNLDEDKILRSFLALIDATLRTNFYQLDENGEHKSYISLKLKSDKVPNLPLPHPCYEVFVYSPAFEAIHLRAAKVARGGLRWSDRHEDFRTEVLGLMKAQQVKNTIIVPSGSKGGFVLKATHPKMTREELTKEAIRCYQNFMRGLLDITDNLKDGQIINPPNVRLFDDDDPYLVVAADKGTATFSDYANAISEEYNFWLGDAFASGGSNGYDHKKIGITSRGAWISVEAHFKALGINPSQEEFTAIGIGDMSGDVFGNGMLRSRKTRLVAAFNHIHIFVDPNPDAETSYKERERLFNLPGSTWKDYNQELISKGGGIFDRNAKSIQISSEIKEILNLTEDEIEPSKLIKAILTAKVDLFFNGGIGTYVKASTERNQDVGDKTNDAVRVNADELQCRIVGEGGNLGFTQLARVEYAEKGGLIFTDFIDNSAGVDLSDHEVNIKILMSLIMHDKELTLEARNALLKDMTNDVANLVLLDNKNQTEALSFANSQALNELEVYGRWLSDFESHGKIDRTVEFLPTDRGIEERLKSGKGLTTPEIAVIMAYIKMDIKSSILKSDIPEDPYFKPLVHKEFPAILNERYSEAMKMHRLRREIIATQLTNQLLNETGILFIHRLKEETSMSTSAIIKAYAVVREIFDIPAKFASIRSLDYQVPYTLQQQMLHRLIRFIRRATRWLLHRGYPTDSIQATIESWHLVKETTGKLPNFLLGVAQKQYQQFYDLYLAAKISPEIANEVAIVRSSYALLDINAISIEKNCTCDVVTEAYFKLGTELNLDWLREEITNHDVSNQWDALAHSNMRDDLDQLQAQIVRAALKQFCETGKALNVEEWLESHSHYIEKWHGIHRQLARATKLDYVMFSVALSVLRTLVEEIERAA